MNWVLRRIKLFLTMRQLKCYEYTCECGILYDGEEIEEFFKHQMDNEHWKFTKKEK